MKISLDDKSRLRVAVKMIIPGRSTPQVELEFGEVGKIASKTTVGAGRRLNP